MKKLFLLLAVVSLVSLLVACGEKPQNNVSGDKEPVISTETKSGETEVIDVKPEYKETNPYVANIPNEILDFYKEKIEAIEEAVKQRNEERLKENKNTPLDSLEKMKYDLVFFDDNNTPELVATSSNNAMSLYTYDAGQVIFAMKPEDGDDEEEYGWPFGVGGNAGYEYIPRENTMRFYNNEFAGLIRYVSYMELDPDTHQLEGKYKDPLYEVHYDDKNKNGDVDEDEMDFVEEAVYKYGDKEITSGEWATYMVEGDYEELVGTKSASEILTILEGLINEK